jgi:hypothetical protein
MDSLINAAAQALSMGDALGALKRVALRDDPPALALRGMAMAQLGDLDRAKTLLKSAGKAFGPRERMSRARCIVAEAEIALATRDLAWPKTSLDEARALLEAHGDRRNAAHARLLAIRRLLLLGQLDEAERRLAKLDASPLPAAGRAIYELAVAGAALRRIDTRKASAAIARAERYAAHSGITALLAEVESARRLLEAPAAKLIVRGNKKLIRLADVGALFESNRLVVDACRCAVRKGRTIVVLSSRPVLFGLARALAEAWPGDMSRATLLARAFGAKFADESHRARLRVEIGRLRKAIKTLAEVSATAHGFRLTPHGTSGIAILTQPIEDEDATVLALLADGESWSSSALALALDASARTVQRSLNALAARGKVQAIGKGRARRWMTPPILGFTTTLLLPAPLASG